jgi:succinoglycan biosynthesis transport protein ExoP
MSDFLPAIPTPVTSSVPPAVLHSRPNALALLKALRRRWLLACLAGLLGAALFGSATWVFAPQKHMALSLLQVQLPFNLVIEHRGPRNLNDLTAHQKNQISLVKSRLVLDKALRRPEVVALSVVRDQDDPLDWLEKHIQADFSLAPETLRIWMTGDKPEELVVLVKAVREAYIQEFFETDRKDREEQLVMLAGMHDRYQKLVNEGKKHRQDPTIPRNAPRQELRIRFAQEDLANTQQELRQNEQELRRARKELSVYEERAKMIFSPEIPAGLLESVKDNEATLSLAKDVEKLRTQLATSAAFYTKGDLDPHLRGPREELKAKLKMLTALRKDILRNDIKRQIATEQTKISLGEKEKSWLEAEVKRLRTKVDDMMKRVEDFENIDDNISAEQNILNRIITEEEALKLESYAPKRAKVLDDGYSKPPSGPSRSVASALGAMAGLIFACFSVSWWEFRARRIETVEEVIQGLGIKLLGAIPDLSPRWFGVRNRYDQRSQHLFVESIDTTRTMLLEGARAESGQQGEQVQPVPQVVMVTSAQSGEGKTSLSTHLAASLAQIGHRTLLIDADLRNPTAHRIIGLSGEPGCCELLRGEVELADVIRPTPIDGLWMITGGRWDSRATRALAQPQFGSLIQQLRADFEFILIDSSPVLPVVDPLLLARHADIVLLSVLCNVSRMKNVYTACQRLAGVGIRSLRAVMSGVRGEAYDSSYQYFSSGQIQV